jgi:putative ABC transport system permease protein
MQFLTVVLKNTIRRPLRSTLTVIAIAIAVGSVVSLVGIASGFEETFLSLYKNAGVDLIVVRAGAKQRLTSTLDESLGERIKKLPGVKEVIPGLADVVSFEDFGLYGVLVQGWVAETRVFDHIQVLSGRSLRRDDRKAVMLGSVLAKNLDKKVGDRLHIFEDEDFTVVGTYKSNNIFEEGAMIIPLAQLQRLMDRPGQVTGFSILLENSGDKAALERIRGQVMAMETGLTALTTAEHVKSVTEIQLAKAMAWLTSAVALLIGFFGIMNTMIMSVHERTREIGILRAIGWRRYRVVRMILFESIVLSVVGAIVGSLGAFLLVRILTRVPTVSGLISGRIHPVFVLYGLLIALVVGFVGGLLPAYRASRMLPTVALRYE